MPRTTQQDPSSTPEDRSVLVAAAHATVAGTVATASTARLSHPTDVRTVALRQNLSPTATPAERRAHLVACLVEAGVLTPEGEAGPQARLTDTLTGGILTPGQAEVIVTMAAGLSYTGAASHLSRNVGTVKKHLAHAYTALGVGSYPEAVIAAVRSGAIPLGVILATAGPEDATTQAERVRGLYTALRGTQEAPTQEAPAERAPLAACSGEGCRKRTRHASGACPDHRA